MPGLAAGSDMRALLVSTGQTLAVDAGGGGAGAAAGVSSARGAAEWEGQRGRQVCRGRGLGWEWATTRAAGPAAPYCPHCARSVFLRRPSLRSEVGDHHHQVLRPFIAGLMDVPRTFDHRVASAVDVDSAVVGVGVAGELALLHHHEQLPMMAMSASSSPGLKGDPAPRRRRRPRPARRVSPVDLRRCPERGWYPAPLQEARSIAGCRRPSPAPDRDGECDAASGRWALHCHPPRPFRQSRPAGLGRIRTKNRPSAIDSI